MKTSRYNHFFHHASSDEYLAFNARTLALTKLPPGDHRALTTGGGAPGASFEALAPEDRDALREGGFLVEDDKDELNELLERFLAIKHDGKSMVVTIAPTIWCNFACPYCFEGNKPRGTMSTEVQDQVVGFLARQFKRKSVHNLSVAWYGGEPLLAQQVLWNLSSKMIALCEERDVHYSSFIVTNGSLLTADVARRLVEHRISRAQVTIDGPREVHDRMRPYLGGKGKSTFDVIVRNLEEIVGILPIALRINIDRSNAASAVDLVVGFRERGWLASGKRFTFYFAQLHDPTVMGSPGCKDTSGSCYDRQSYAELELDLHRQLLDLGIRVNRYPSLSLGSCGTVSSTGWVIGPKGELYKCWESAGIPEQVVGHVSDLDLPVENPSLLSWMKWDPFQDEACRECAVLPTCMGGCPAHALKLGRSSGINCTSWKFNLEENILLYLRSLEAAPHAEKVQAGTSSAAPCS